MSSPRKRWTGVCKKFNVKKGFGFITSDDGDGDIFVHQKEIICHGSGAKSLKKGDIVQFHVMTQGDGRRKATHVTKVGTSTHGPSTSKIRKIGTNETVHYGDGGMCDMKWEIYISDNFKNGLNAKIESRLKKELIQLGTANDDWRDNEPIQNIIDPDLYVYKFYDKEQYWLSKAHHEEFDRNEVRHGDEAANAWKQIKQHDEKGYFIRRKYQWLATEFKENEDVTVSICSPIHNISPRCDFPGIYDGIEYIFGKMLPLFNKFPAFRERKQKGFQVIVKSQRYAIEDMSGYSGHWHQEGLTEHIIMGGLYYFERNKGMEGGNLRFRNVKQPDDCYAEYLDEQVVHEAQIKQGTAVVFDNVHLVHRVRLLKNKIGDKQTRYRSFLAFFIVDPDKRIKSTKDVASCKREEFTSLIMKNTVIETEAIASLICEYGACGYTLSQAQNIRKMNIEVRKKPVSKGKWATMHFGNCGDQIWFGNGKVYPTEHLYYDDVNWQETTHSEL
eukprot:253289_1